MNLPSGTLLQNGRYQVMSKLGQGSFGITYLASVNLIGSLGSIPTKSKVAIKEFFMRDVNGRSGETVTTGSKNGVFYDYKRRFIKEARTLSKLRHPNIVKVLDLFEENNTAYYVMEYLDGGSLDYLISSKEGLSLIECNQIIRQIASALQYMHSNKMLHLDLKPANVMLNSKGDAILIDFGLTKQFDENGIPESSTTIGHGTPGYAPIEQANYQSGQGFPVTMDVYALGATLYKMLTGDRPPAASEVLNDGLSLVDLQNRNCPNDIISLVKSAMEPLRVKRIQTVAEFLSKLPFDEDSKSRCFVDHDSISVFIKMNNDAVIFYFHGHIYKDLDGRFWQSVKEIPSISSMKGIFVSTFEEHPHLLFEDFVKEYRNLMSHSKVCIISYNTQSGYWRIIKSGIGRRLIRESSTVCAYLSLFENDDNGISIVSYGNCLYTFGSDGDGYCEIKEDAESISELQNKGISIGRKYQIKTSQNLMYSVLGGIVIIVQTLLGNRKDFLLLDTYPYDIYFGPKWGNVIPKLIDRGTTIPTRCSDKYDFAGTDFVGIKIGDKTFTIDLTKIFKSIPKEVDCTAEIEENGRILFTIKNIQTGEIKEYRMENLKFYNQSDMTTHWDDWKEPEWT